jgi:hypothetical protein
MEASSEMRAPLVPYERTWSTRAASTASREGKVVPALLRTTGTASVAV